MMPLSLLVFAHPIKDCHFNYKIRRSQGQFIVKKLLLILLEVQWVVTERSYHNDLFLLVDHEKRDGQKNMSF